MSKEVQLGKVIISIGNRVVGTADNLALSIVTASPEELKYLQDAKILVLYRTQGTQPLDGISPVQHVRVPVTPKKYLDALVANQDRDYVLVLKAWEVPILHGLVALAADHPGVMQMSRATHAVIISIRNWCKAVFTDWGFSPGEALYLDTMREDFQENISPEDRPANNFTISSETMAHIEEMEKGSRYPTGVGKIQRGECPIGGTNPMSCMLCNFGHMLECHYPMSCEEAQCSHYRGGDYE